MRPVHLPVSFLKRDKIMIKKTKLKMPDLFDICRLIKMQNKYVLYVCAFFLNRKN